ncbi:uncharacterized protein APUU_50209S [Aspergillus puulaauensis]|uniref:Uncharacterized protein n=1 Tax=Aspergillus puulaauensis TaxID=1220207 RepID=A0A7R7XRE0_9EURO|nr:uncharacterized protein APUU_50209S [Aspergillus puulaauensis]BCS25498.1 hypothetical protein APUU_50209S [Aspergillus puulaauensis]
MAPHEPIPGAFIVAAVAEIFFRERVPYIFSGWMLMSLIGRRYAFPMPDFVIPDKLIDKAIAILSHRGYSPCPNPTCLEFTGNRQRNCKHFWNQFHPVGKAHFHLEGDVLLTILPKSEIFPWIPDYTPGPPTIDDPHLTVTSDMRLAPATDFGATGPWTELFPIQMPNPNTFREAILYLMALHEPGPSPSTPKLRFKFYPWLHMKEALMPSPDLRLDDDPPILSLGRPAKLSEIHAPEREYERTVLQPKYRPVWEYLSGHRPPNHHPHLPLLRLREKMIETGELPHDLPKYDLKAYKPLQQVTYYRLDQVPTRKP